MEHERYLSRLGVDPSSVSSVDAETLGRLQEAHVRAIPFENLAIVGDPHGGADVGPGISLARADLYEKIVERRRGGLCFELNGLFYWLLAELGIDVRCHAGRVYVGPGGQLGPHESHLTLVVTLEGEQYVVDAGFGDVIRHPVPFDGTVRETVDGDWRVVDDSQGDADHVIQFRGPASQRWTPRYVFDETPRDLSSFEAAREYHETDPDAPFTGAPIVTRATERGRVTLSRDSITWTEGGEKRKRPVDPAAWASVLEQEFDVTIGAD